MNRHLLTVIIFSLSSLALPISSHTMSGLVKDNKTGEPLIGAVIKVKEFPNVYTITGLDGSFRLSELPDKGTVTLVCSFISYKKREVPVDVKAEENTVIPMDEESNMISEVTINGKENKSTDHSAISIEKSASQVLNVMSAQSIQIAPDVNVATSLQRISGVTMQKDATGEASYAILRGMDKRYNYTLVNGIKIPSPDDKNRYVPLNMFPNDLMDRLAVTKSLTADMEGDATGGAIDMEMKDAPSHFRFQANAATGLSDYFLKSGHDYYSFSSSDITATAPYEKHGSDYSATASDFKSGSSKITSHAMSAPNLICGMTVGDRLCDGKLGLIFAGNIQNRYRGADRTFYNSGMSWGQQAMDIVSRETRKYSFHDLTYGLHAKADMNLGSNKIEWYNMLVGMTTSGVRLSDKIYYQYGYDAGKGNYTLNNEFRTNKQTERVLTSHLKGTHQLLPNFCVDWSGVFALAKSDEPDRTYINLTSTVENNAIVKTQIDNSPGMERRFQHNTDKDWSGFVNIKYSTPTKFTDILWKAGAMYRKKNRENRFYSYTFRATDDDDTRSDNSFDGLSDVEWVIKTPHAQASQLNYNSKEHIGGTYAMVKLSNDFGELVAGIRAEHTNNIYTMLQKFENLGSTGEQSYWDYLPSVALKYTPLKDINIRLSYYKSINRPGFYEIIPYQLMGDDYIEQGNPKLKRAKIDNADLRFEWFPSSNEQVFVGLFYKYLKDPIEQSFATIDGRNMIYSPQNLGNAKNYGIEIDVIKYIRNFGIKANYTYTHSRITTTKQEYVTNSADKTIVMQSRPLVNQAPHTANLSLLYKDTQYGWNAQLAGAYTGTHLAVVSEYKDADQWDKGTFSLDFSMEKMFKHGLSLFVKANNLTDMKNERYLKTVKDSNLAYPGQKSDRTVIGTYRYGRTFLVGLRLSL